MNYLKMLLFSILKHGIGKILVQVLVRYLQKVDLDIVQIIINNKLFIMEVKKNLMQLCV